MKKSILILVVLAVLSINAQEYEINKEGQVVEVELTTKINVTVEQVEMAKNNPGVLVYYDEPVRENFKVIDFWHYNYNNVQKYAIVSENGKNIKPIIKLKIEQSKKEFMWFLILMLIVVILMIISNVEFKKRCDSNSKQNPIFAFVSTFFFIFIFALAFTFLVILSKLLTPALALAFASTIAATLALASNSEKNKRFYWISSIIYYILTILSVASLYIF